MMLSHQFGKRLKYLRTIRSVTQAQLAEAVDVSVQYLSRIERGQVSPSFNVISKLCDALEVEPADLFVSSSSGDKESAPRELEKITFREEVDWQSGVAWAGAWKRDYAKGLDVCYGEECQVLGNNINMERPFSEQMIELAHVLDKSKVQAFFDAVAKGKSEPLVTFRFYGKHGEVCHAIASVSIEADDAGAPKVASGMLLDVTRWNDAERLLIRTHQQMEAHVKDRTFVLTKTVEQLEKEIEERSKAEQALSEKEENYRMIFESATDAFFMHDAKTGEILDANKRMLELYKCTLDQAKQLGLSAFCSNVPPYTLDNGKELIRKAAAGEHQSYEWLAKDINGRLFWTEVDLKIIQVRGEDKILAVVRDIDQRRQDEEALRHSAAKLNEAQSVARLGSWERDLRTKECVWSDTMYTILGYAPGEVEASPAVLIELVQPKNVKMLTEVMSTGKRGEHKEGMGTEVEFHFRRKDGKERWARISRGNVTKREDGSERVFGTLQDITEQREREAELHLLRNAVDRSPASIVITNEDGEIQYANRYYCQNLEISGEEAVGRTPGIFTQGFLSSSLYEAMQYTLKMGRMWRSEVEMPGKAGATRWEDVSVAPLVDDAGRTHYVIIKEDVTQQKRREEGLYNTLAEFETLFDNSSVGIVELAADKTIRRVNRRVGEIFGYDSENFVDENLSSLQISEDNFKAVGPEEMDAIVRGEIVQIEEQLRRKDGSLIWCALHGKAVEPADLNKGVVWVVENITERKNLEILREDVERIMRHDLKSPLNGIIALPQILMQDDNLTEEQIKVLRGIEESGYNILNQINLSLDLYKMETGSYQYFAKVVDLRKLLERLSQEHERLAQRFGVLLEARIDNLPLNQAATVLIRADALLSYTMLSNLIQNAIEASPTGEVVTIRTVTLEDNVHIYIHNLGAVPGEVRGRFFKKYVTYGKEQGTGLGTYSAKLMAETQGGKISLQTSDAKGTTLTVSLPK